MFVLILALALGQAPSGAPLVDAGAGATDASSVEPRETSVQGIWSFATLTPFERPADLANKRYFTDEEAADMLARNDRDRRDGGAAVDAARGVADFWFDRGTG